MKKILLLFTFMITFGVAGCTKYDKLPPRTSSDNHYLLPQGEIPTQAEKDIIQEMIDEYNNAVN